MRSLIESQLATKIAPKLVAELLDSHEEVKRNFYLGGLRLSAVEGGRFCEAAFRVLEEMTGRPVTPLNKQINSEGLINNLANLNANSYPDSIRLHIPRSLRVVYYIRNKRDAGI